MRKSPRSFTSAFTLIELLTVIAIIGILAAIIIPTVGAVREKAQRAVDGNNLREIIKAAQIYAGDNNDRLPDPRAVPAATMTANPQSHLWPGIIARNNILTDATFYFSKSDPFFNGVYPISIISTTDTTKRYILAVIFVELFHRNSGFGGFTFVLTCTDQTNTDAIDQNVVGCDFFR